jgi:uncharacterized RDD family membrane protein YckC
MKGGIPAMPLNMKDAAFDNESVSATTFSGKYNSSIIVSRWLGAWIDFIVLASFLLIPDYLLGNSLYQRTIFVWLGLIVVYFPFMESACGKTIGKFVTRTRVVDSQGRKPSLRQSIVRSLFRLIEVNPLLLGGLPAGIAVLASKNRQRLGDMVAGTYVLKDSDVLQILAAKFA